MATHYSILAGKIARTVGPGGLQFNRSQSDTAKYTVDSLGVSLGQNDV